MPVQNFRDLIAWQRSIDFVVEVYDLSREFPADERFGLTSQLRKAAISISSNIAEGSGRASTRELLNFLNISRGSLKESESLLVVSQRLGFSTEDQCIRSFALADEIGRLTAGLRASLQRSSR